MSQPELLQFAPFSSAVDAGFWYQLTKRKLDIYKLDDTPVNIYGFYTNNNRISPGLPPILNIDYSAFDEITTVPPGNFQVKGLLQNTNTLEEFKLKDKKELIHSAGQKIWEAIKDGSALENPSVLQFFLCLTFADLKKYHYYYWVAFPAFTYPESTVVEGRKELRDYLSEDLTSQFLSSYELLSSSDKTVFLIHMDEGKCCASELKNYESLKSRGGKIVLGVSDPSSYASVAAWPLRNALSLVAYHWGKEQSNWDVICLRLYVKDGKRNYEHSLVLSIKLNLDSQAEDCPGVVGWEKSKDKLAPRKVNMSANMDPLKLAETAVELNLKLMRWRLSPNLQLQNIKSSKCLLFGAGTLGCNVARCLLGWGVQKITFIDNASVSFSNPVRQTLFHFEDCLQGGKPKATAAADALKKIFPGVDAEGKCLSVPMPGHAVSENTLEQVRGDVNQIEELIGCHDVIFLLMDTRESRWLPTLLGAAHEKIVINAALGFDTFLVMRHGLRSPEVQSSGDELRQEMKDVGCYFCNDIVAPGNSVQDRTLDQQCTVTRPGVSYIAAALAVELMVSVLQHPKRAFAPATILAPGETPNDEDTTELGIVPHQIRGYLNRFHNSVLASKAFDRCTACSRKVLDQYRRNGFEFLLKVFNDPNYLEEVTGLSELMTNINMDEIYVLSDDESV